MAIDPTRVSRLSVGFVDSKRSLVDVDPGDTGAVFSVTGPTAFAGTQTITGAETITSTLSVGGAATFTTSVAVGGGTALQVISTGTAAVSLGAIAPLESSSVQTIAVSGLSRGDFLAITVDSIYPNVAANRDISWMCSSSSTAGEGHVWGVNSTLTSVTPTASTFIRWVRIKAGNYPAA
jgi:hypothetical protein